MVNVSPKLFFLGLSGKRRKPLFLRNLWKLEEWISGGFKSKLILQQKHHLKLVFIPFLPLNQSILIVPYFTYIDLNYF